VLAFQNACCRGSYFRFFLLAWQSLMVSDVMTASILPTGLEFTELQDVGGSHWWDSAGG